MASTFSSDDEDDMTSSPTGLVTALMSSVRDVVTMTLNKEQALLSVSSVIIVGLAILVIFLVLIVTVIRQRRATDVT